MNALDKAISKLETVANNIGEPVRVDEAGIARKAALRMNDLNRKGDMHFTPFSGYCYSCNGDLVAHYGAEKYASGINVTGCPICHHSYCD